MEVRFEFQGDTFIWEAEINWRKHGIRFEAAASVFSDPLFVVVDASRRGPAGDDWIRRFGAAAFASASFPCGGPPETRKPNMLSERTKKRLAWDRPMTMVTLRIPVDAVESLKALTPLKGFSGYQTLLKAYISEGLRHDEALFADDRTVHLIEALKKRGVPENLIDEATRELA